MTNTAISKDGRLRVENRCYDDLPKKQQAEWEFRGDSYSNDYLVVLFDEEIILVENSGAEPEDYTFYRDLSWIKDAIVQAYELKR